MSLHEAAFSLATSALERQRPGLTRSVFASPAAPGCASAACLRVTCRRVHVQGGVAGWAVMESRAEVGRTKVPRKGEECHRGHGGEDRVSKCFMMCSFQRGVHLMRSDANDRVGRDRQLLSSPGRGFLGPVAKRRNGEGRGWHRVRPQMTPIMASRGAVAGHEVDMQVAVAGCEDTPVPRGVEPDHADGHTGEAGMHLRFLVGLKGCAASSGRLST